MSEKWRTVPLSEICDINPRLGKIGLADEELFAFVPMATVGAADGSIDVSTKRPYAEVKKGFTPFQSSDVLFAKITPCMENGKMAVVPKLENRYGFGSTEFHVIRPKDGVDPKYVYHYVSRSDFRKEAARHMTGAVGQKRVPTDFLKQSLIPLPPTLDDQKRIVAEIEKQFSRLDEAMSSLKRIQANLKHYKAAVLKAAAEGKLTEQWRKDHPDVEPADQLLKRILTERRAKWEAKELAKKKAKGIKPKDDSWKKKYKEPTGPDTGNLPKLPEGWVWAALGQLIEEPSYGTSKKCDYDSGAIGVLRIPNIVNDIIDCNDLKSADFDENEKRAYALQAGDILTIRSNGSVSLVGKCALVRKKDTKFLYAGYLIRLRPSSGGILSKYLMAFLSSQLLRRQIEAKAKSTSGVNNINSGELQSLIVPLCSTEEQCQIIAELDSILSVTEELEATIETNLNRAERLQQTILQQSFSDKLVRVK